MTADHTDKTHIADLSSELQHLMSEAFERRVIALKAKLRAECDEIRVDRDRLITVNERQAARIDALSAELGYAQTRIDEQARRIAMLKNEIASERNLRTKIEQQTRNARQHNNNVNTNLKNSFKIRRRGLASSQVVIMLL